MTAASPRFSPSTVVAYSRLTGGDGAGGARALRRQPVR
jgi:hypothetical protein